MENRPSDIDRVAIIGIGLVTSLGCSASTSLAAIRSGIANFSEHETVMVNDDAYGTELCGAKIARVSEHVVSRRVLGADRAVAMLVLALRECISGLPHEMLSQANWRVNSRMETRNENFTDRLLAELHDLPIPALQGYDPATSALGRCLFFESVIQAVADLRNGTCPMAIVGCVDSLCENAILEKLFESDRLKSGTNPEGFIAGEAAGAVLLELESHARRRNAVIHAFISACGRGTEPHPWSGATPSTAHGLTGAFHQAFTQLSGKGKEIDMVIADLNGERSRSHEWGLTAARIFPIDDKTRELLHQADSAGDCGAAMGAVLLASAAGLMSGALPPMNVALSTSDDGGARRILCLEKGDDRDDDAVINNKSSTRTMVLRTVVEQHCDDAPFLWLLRNRLAKAPHRGLFDLTRHDERIQAHLDGLRLAGETGWGMCKDALQQGDAGEYFAASFLAFKSGDEGRITYLLDNGGTGPNRSKGVISALGWLPFSQAQQYIRRFMAEQSPDQCRIGIAASAIHRMDPGKYLKDALLNVDHALKARALKAVGELGRSELLPALRENLSHEDETCRFFAAWSAALLGDRNALPVLQSVAVSSGHYQEEAIKMAFRIMKCQNALEWHAELAANTEITRMAVIGAGTAGFPMLIPWLIDQMKTQALARVAGEAFALITGADILSDELKGARRDCFWPLLTDDPSPEDENVGIDEDEDIPWPEQELVKEWWQHRGNRFSCKARYFLGKTISATHLQQVLYSGSQRQRAIAATESALLNPGLPCFEIRAPGFRQLHTLVTKLNCAGEVIP